MVFAATGAVSVAGAGFFAAEEERTLGVVFSLAGVALGAEAFAVLASAGFFAGARGLLCGFFVSVAEAGVESTFFAEARDRPCVEPLGFLSLGFVMVRLQCVRVGVEVSAPLV